MVSSVSTRALRIDKSTDKSVNVLGIDVNSIAADPPAPTIVLAISSYVFAIYALAIPYKVNRLFAKNDVLC